MYTFPGYSIHKELKMLVQVGLTPYQALLTGTSNAAECLNKEVEFGTITEGKYTNLILLEQNPLLDITNTKRIKGVMICGQWLSQKTIHEKLLEISKQSK